DAVEVGVRKEGLRSHSEPAEGSLSVENPEIKKGSSRFTGERGSDLEEEVVGVAVAVGHALDDLDAVVDAFEDAGIEAVTGAGDDAVSVLFQPARKGDHRRDAAVEGHAIPLVPATFGGTRTGGGPQRLQLLLQQVRREQRLVRGEQVVQRDGLGVGQV